MSSHSTVDISLQGREYRVTCAPDERELLLAAASHVETKMNDIASRTKGSGERLAVMTALNLAHELLSKGGAEPGPVVPTETTESAANNPPTRFDSPEIARRIDSMVARLDAVMAQQESLL